MNLRQHSEYASYHKDRLKFEGYRQVIKTWAASDDRLPVEAFSFDWSYTSAMKLVCSLSQMLQAYNRVLYEQLPYCPPCGGRCCGVGAVHVSRFDMLAMALLDFQYPYISDGTQIRERDCIYQSFSGCAWPADWRTMKCWLFYCLGSGDWNLSESVDIRYQEIVEKLKPVVAETLPDVLHRYEQSSNIRFATYLFDPLVFANKLEMALDNILVVPIFDRYGHQITRQVGEYGDHVVDNEGINIEALLAEESISTLVTEIAAQMESGSETDISIDQILADLERVEWIVMGNPRNSIELLEEMETRYCLANNVKEDSLISIMGILIKRLQDKI